MIRQSGLPDELFESPRRGLRRLAAWHLRGRYFPKWLGMRQLERNFVKIGTRVPFSRTESISGGKSMPYRRKKEEAAERPPLPANDTALRPSTPRASGGGG
jgi:hypothetical protein